MYIPPWNTYTHNKKYSKSWTEDFLGPKMNGQIHHMSQLLNRILLRKTIIPRSIHPHVHNMSSSSCYFGQQHGATSCPHQGHTDSFPFTSHVSNVQLLYVAAENSHSCRYTDKEEDDLVIHCCKRCGTRRSG